MVGGWWAEDGEDDGDPASDGFGAVEDGGGREEELFLRFDVVAVGGRGLPGCHGCAEEVDGYGVMGG